MLAIAARQHRQRLVGAVRRALGAASAARFVQPDRRQRRPAEAPQQPGKRRQQRQHQDHAQPPPGGGATDRRGQVEQEKAIQRQAPWQPAGLPGGQAAGWQGHGRQQQQPTHDPHPEVGREPLGTAQALDVQPQQAPGDGRKPQVQRDHQQDKAPAGAGPAAIGGQDQPIDQESLAPGGPLEQVYQALVERLGARIPHQPVAGHPDDPYAGRHAHPGDPGQPARAAEAVLKEGAPAVQQGGDHRRAGGVAVQGAHQPPQEIGLDGRHRLVGSLETELVEQGQVDPAGQDHQQQENGDRPGVVQRVELRVAHPTSNRRFQGQ